MGRVRKGNGELLEWGEERKERISKGKEGRGECEKVWGGKKRTEGA